MSSQAHMIKKSHTDKPCATGLGGVMVKRTMRPKNRHFVSYLNKIFYMKFNNPTDKESALRNYHNHSKEELITLLCFYIDLYKVERKQCVWLDNLANYLRDSDIAENKQDSDMSYAEYQSSSIELNNKYTT